MKGYNSISEWVQDIIEVICLLQDGGGERRRVNTKAGNSEAGNTFDSLENVFDGESVRTVKEDFLQDLLYIREQEQVSSVLIPAVSLRQYLQLTDLEYWLMLTALSMEVDTGLCLLYHNRYGKEVPDLQYGLHLLSNVLSVNVEFVGELCDRGHRLWQLFEWPSGEELGLTLQKPMKLQRMVVCLLLTGRILLPEPGCEYLAADLPEAELLYPKTFEEMTKGLEEHRWTRMLFHGRRGSGKKTLIHQICYHLQVPGIFVELQKIWELERVRQEKIFRDLSFAAQMTQGIVILACVGLRQQEGREALWIKEFADRYFSGQILVILTEDEPAKGLFYEMAEAVFCLPDYLPLEEKKLLLDLLLPEEYRERWQDAFVGRYRLTAAELTDRLQKVTAAMEPCERRFREKKSYGRDSCERNLCGREFCGRNFREREFCERNFRGREFCGRDSCEREFCERNFCGRESCEKDSCKRDFWKYNAENFTEIVRKNSDICQTFHEEQSRWSRIFQAEVPFSLLGKKVELPYTLADYAGQEDCKQQLEQVIRLAGIWREQTENWNAQGGGFTESLCILFHGSSGTGKTMSASILANELGMTLLRVDLSSVFDKYIGETEKHLEEVLNSAQRSNAILFFDEADALFSKRTEISDSHDKYANVSVSYLLQRIEEYSGIIILATNLINQFDDAFLRRIRFVLRFQPLEEGQRTGLWKMILSRLPAGYLLAEDVSARELAASADLSPARIKNCALTAVILAASEGNEVIARRHILTAVRWEAQKDHTACNFWDSEDIL